MKKEFLKDFYTLFAGEYAGEYAGVYTHVCSNKNISADSYNVIDNNSPINTISSYRIKYNK